MAQEKTEYRNATAGIIGVVTIENGKERGIAVKSGETIWLSEDERIATANAPRKEEDNPLANGSLVLETPASEIKNRRPIGADTHEEPQAETPPDPEPPAPEPDPEPAPPEPVPPAAEAEKARAAEAKAQAEQGARPVDGEGKPKTGQTLPHQGERAAAEEVATPAAEEKATPPPAKPKPKAKAA